MQPSPFTGLTRLGRGAWPVLSVPPRLFISVVALLALLVAKPALSADDYLSELEAEVKKVEARKIDGESGVSTVEAPAEVSDDKNSERAGVSRDAFEAMLRKRYLGTFGFYKKLPERSRQEIFAEYLEGAPIAEVRKKIIDRLLQR